MSARLEAGTGGGEHLTAFHLDGGIDQTLTALADRKFDFHIDRSTIGLGHGELKTLAQTMRQWLTDDLRSHVRRVDRALERKFQGASEALQHSSDDPSQASNSLIELIDRLLRGVATKDEVLTWIKQHHPGPTKELSCYTEKGIELPTKRAEVLHLVYAGLPLTEVSAFHEIVATVIIKPRGNLQAVKHADNDLKTSQAPSQRSSTSTTPPTTERLMSLGPGVPPEPFPCAAAKSGLLRAEFVRWEDRVKNSLPVLEGPPDHWFRVGLSRAYLNLNPQLTGLLKRLQGPLPARGPATGPVTPDSPNDQPPVAYPPAPPRALGKRLSPTDQAELIATFNAGTTQKALAATYGISITSVKRLVHGSSNRPQATANRLTPDQRDAIAATYATTGATKTELARAHGVGLSTIKRILRDAR